MIKIAYSDRFVLDLPEEHKFPMIKYELIKEQLLYEGTITEDNLFDPGLIDEEIVRLTHDATYLQRVKSQALTKHEIRRIGFPMTEKLYKRSLSSSCGTLYAVKNALRYGIGFNTAGGTHHAFKAKGEGFCILNDIAISSNWLLNTNEVQKILVVDLDVHQGNGTASIFENNSKVFTFSMHGADNYPLKKEKSDLDIGLKAYTEDETYLGYLKHHLPRLIESEKPDFIFYQAGVDIIESDALGKLNVSRQGCKQRDEIVLEACYNNGIPVAVSMGGGYSPRVADIVDAHCNTYRSAFQIYD